MNHSCFLPGFSWAEVHNWTFCYIIYYPCNCIIYFSFLYRSEAPQNKEPEYEEEEEILGSDDDEQEDPSDYEKGIIRNLTSKLLFADFL